jgi:hypothetical protein
MVEPFAGGYYEVGEKEKARAILSKLIKKYQENLTYFAGLKTSEQNDMAVEIITNIERYRSLLQTMKDRGDVSFYEQEKVSFNNHNKRFDRFNRDFE